MKKIVCFFFSLLATLVTTAQTQQGFVKTKGRMINGQYVKGKGLPGASIILSEGNSCVVRNNDGSFSFPLSSKTFYVKEVRKKGYELVDADVVRLPHPYSAHPLYIVMETPEQQMEDLLGAQERIAKTLREQLKKSRMEVQRLKDEKRISEQDYHQRIALLMESQNNSQKLIEEMAQEYARMDYDQMDERNQLISNAILDGRLTEADSLLHLKGDIRSRILEIRKEMDVEDREEAEQAKRQANLRASKMGTRRRMEDVAIDCKNYFDRYLIENRYDSAACYIELRAGIDNTNAQWQYEAAQFFLNQRQYAKANHYYDNALLLCRELAKNNPQAYEPDVAQTLNNLAIIYRETRRFKESEAMYLEALGIRRRLALNNPKDYEPNMAQTLNNLANLYRDTRQFYESEVTYQEALEIRRRLARQNPKEHEAGLASTLNNLANLFYFTRRFKESEAMYLEALEIRKRLAKSNHQKYDYEVASTLNNLGILYRETQRFGESESMCLEALAIKRKLAENNPEVYLPEVASTLYSLGNLYFGAQRFKESETMFQEALGVFRCLTEENRKANIVGMTSTLNMLSYIYAEQKKFADAVATIEQAVELTPNDPNLYDTKGEILLMSGDESGALEMWRKAVETDPDFLKKNNGTTELYKQLKERGLTE